MGRKCKYYGCHNGYNEEIKAWKKSGYKEWAEANAEKAKEPPFNNAHDSYGAVHPMVRIPNVYKLVTKIDKDGNEYEILEANDRERKNLTA